MWTLAFGHHEDRTPTHGYEPTREAAMAAFAKSGGAPNGLLTARQHPDQPIQIFLTIEE